MDEERERARDRDTKREREKERDEDESMIEDELVELGRIGELAVKPSVYVEQAGASKPTSA